MHRVTRFRTQSYYTGPTLASALTTALAATLREPAGARKVMAIQPSWLKGQPSWSAAPGREPARRNE